jgi:CheY-like chemotaxis protein
VDDQEDVADSLAGILEALGQQVTVAYSGEAALAAACDQHPEIAFVDLSMPGMGGAELARRLRQQCSSNGLILIALTGLSKEVAAAQGGGFDRHVLKPVSPESIAVLLDELNREANEAGDL